MGLRNYRPLTPASYQEMLNKLSQSGEGQVQARQQAAADTQKQLEAYSQLPSQVDLSSLSKLVDEWTGSNLTQAYNRPVSPEERMQVMNQLQGAYQRAQVGVSDAEAQMLENQLNSQLKIDKLFQEEKEAQARAQERKLAQDQARQVKETTQQLSSADKYRKDFGEKIEGLGDFAAALAGARELVKKHGGIPTTGDDATTYESYVSTALTNYNRDVAKLGALAGPDLGILSGAVSAGPDALKTAFSKLVRGQSGKGSVDVFDRLLNQTDNAIKVSDKKVKEGFKGQVDDLHKIYVDEYRTKKSSVSQEAPFDPDTASKEDLIKFLGQ